MDLEEKEKITIIEAILEAEEEVKVTPPARRKKAERMKNKASGCFPQLACDDESKNSSVIDALNDGSLLTDSKLDEKDEVGESMHGLSSQVDLINSAESHETKNGMLVSCAEEINGNERSFGNSGNSCVGTNDSRDNLAALANEANSLSSLKENEEVAATFDVLNVIKEEPRVGKESCISPDITSGSQDEESFFSAEEAETTSEFISSTLPELTEIVNETTVDSENSGVLSSVNSENTNINEQTEGNLEQDDQELSGAQISDSTECSSKLLQLSTENSDESFEDHHVSAENTDKDLLSVETDLVDKSITNGDIFTTARVDSPYSDLSLDIELGAVGGTLDSESDEEWSSSSNTSSEGEYDVGYFEVIHGIEEEEYEGDSKDGLKEILSAFPSGTEVVSVTTDSEDDSNRGDTPRNQNTAESSSPLLDGDDSDTGVKMLAFFSPQSECPVVTDDTNQEKTAVDSVAESSKIGNNFYNDDARTSNFAESPEGEILNKDSDHSEKDTSVLLDTDDTANGISSESANLESQPSEDEDNIIVKRTGSFRLIKNNGLLKVIDTSETPVTKEDVRQARLLKTQSLKGTDIDSGENFDSTGAREVLESAVSKAKTFKEELKNVCADIATLEKMSTEEKSADSESEANREDVGEDIVDSGVKAVIIPVDSMALSEQKPVLKLEGMTINESATEELGDSATEGETEGSVDDVDSSSSNNKRKQWPKRLPLGKRYSLDTGTALLSPEDDFHVELTNFENTNSVKRRLSPVSTEAQTSTAEAKVDGQEDEAIATPSPPPRTVSGRKSLTYSGSFSPGASRAVPHRKEGNSRHLTKRARSERRSKTLPNNVFDMFGSAFKTANSSSELHQGPVTMITDNMPATFPGFPLNRRAQVALELYTTERSYVRGLETVLQLFKKPCEESKLLEKEEVHTMFLNIQDIFFINKDLLFMLLERISHWHDQQCLGDIFLDPSFKIIERMKIYAKYCNNYDSAETLYKQKIRKREFETFLNSCYEHPVCQPGLNLPAYLITIVQRIPRYLLLLEDLLKRTPENHPDHSNLSKALTKMDNLAVYINNQLQTVVGQKAMVELRSRVMGLKAFEVPGRALIKEADVVVNGNKKTRKCLLFNDMLVFAAKGVTRTSEVEQTLELVTLWCMDLEGNNPQSVKEDSLEIYTPEHSYILYAGTKNEKKVWLQKLRTAIAMALHGAEATEKNEIESRKAQFTYKDGRNFCGNFVSGKRNGEGTLSWPNQARYQGDWEDDDRCGWGELMYNSGDKYKGEWLDDKQHGIGTMEYMHGDVYHGQWHQGDMHGKGAVDFKNGDRFEGDFYHNEIQGIGELRCVSGLMYKGEWRHSKKHGKGKMHFANGDVYNGEFANDRISGQGEMQYADGSVYKGQWMDNQRGGQGEFSGVDGTHYVGGWSKDHINGKGRMDYSNGDCYDGNWFKNTRFGQGVMKHSNGDVYEGMFEYDLCSKFGKMTYKDGSVYEGCWLNGVRHGKGKMVYANKKSAFEGDWMYGMRHGEGVLIFANRASYSGHWELDKQHGRGMYTDPSSDYHYEGEWRCGLKHGKGVEETKEGKYEGEWKDNMRHGQGREILACETEFEGRWKENRKHGPGTKKLKTGMMEEQNWQEGKQVDVTSIVVIELPLIQRR